MLDQAAYFDDIAQKPCSDEAYALVKKVAERFSIKSQREWHDLYLFSDVLLLTDSMEAMRAAWRVENGLDLLRSITLPSASFQAMWKKTEAEHYLISENNGGMELMNKLNANIRGGVSCVFQPTALANNWMVLPPVCDVAPELHEYMRKNGKLPDNAPAQAVIRYSAWASKHGYDLSEETSWLTYVDANSLYPPRDDEAASEGYLR